MTFIYSKEHDHAISDHFDNSTEVAVIEARKLEAALSPRPGTGCILLLLHKAPEKD